MDIAQDNFRPICHCKTDGTEYWQTVHIYHFHFGYFRKISYCQNVSKGEHNGRFVYRFDCIFNCKYNSLD